MTDAELTAIQKRAEAATPGPWIAHPWEDDPECCAGIEAASGTEIVKTDCGIYPPEMPDAEFIAHAREDIPALVAEVRRLRAEAAEPRTICGVSQPSAREHYCVKEYDHEGHHGHIGAAWTRNGAKWPGT